YTIFYALGGGALFIGLIWLISRAQSEQPADPTPKPTDIHGSAAWHPCVWLPVDFDMVSRGIHFGKSSDPQYRGKGLGIPTAPITSKPEVHTLIVAKTRAGKGTRVIIPTLLRYDASVLVIDPKGENAAITARTRRDQLG